jgi:hypothetical protein
MVELFKDLSSLLGRVRRLTLKRLKSNSLLTANVMVMLPKVNTWVALELLSLLTLPITNIEKKDKSLP